MNAYKMVDCELSEVQLKHCLFAITEYSRENYARMKLVILLNNFVLIFVGNLASFQILNVCKNRHNKANNPHITCHCKNSMKFVNVLLLNHHSNIGIKVTSKQIVIYLRV